MKGKDFLQRIIGLRSSPLLAVPTQGKGQPETPRVWAICFGESGRRVWIHLVANGVTPRMYPIILDDPIAAHFLRKTMRPEKTIIVSRLDDLLLWRFIKLTEVDKIKGELGGYFIQPSFEQTNAALTIPVIRNQRRAQKLFTNVRVFSKLDFDKQEIKPHWPGMKWLDEKMTNDEKQIVWELLNE